MVGGLPRDEDALCYDTTGMHLFSAGAGQNGVIVEDFNRGRREGFVLSCDTGWQRGECFFSRDGLLQITK